MKTSYNDFYKYYKNLPTGNDANVVKSFKDNIKHWSDLELELGRFLSKVETNEAIALHRHLIEHLSKYIASEEDRCPFNDERKNTFYEYLKNPHSNRLLPIEVEEINNYMSKWERNNWDIKIITFNYTKSIEKLSDYTDRTVRVGTRLIKGSNLQNNGIQSVNLPSKEVYVNLSAIEHIHGFTNERMILGVNDTSQIANEKLQKEAAVIKRYIKSVCNSTYRSRHEEKCQQWIAEANLICLFGLSFGDTDKKWWEMVGNVLEKDCKIILFKYSEKKFGGNEGPDLDDAKEKERDWFLSKTNIAEDLKDKIKENIYVAYNTDMFKLDVGKKTLNDYF
jgi:hypothetical protein